jgi:uncharacterized repeat protein (TIGR01451 family)
MKKITILALCLLSFQFYSAQVIDFPDNNLKTMLLEYSPVIDINGDNEIQVSEALLVTELDLQYAASWAPQVSNTTGLEAFVNLIDLNLRGNLITNTDVTALVNLEILNLNDNQISTIDISQNLNLEVFTIRNNDLTEIDLNHPALLELNVGGNNLSTLDITSELSLQNLYSGGNNISILDLSQNPSLELLYLAGNPLSNLDLSANISLEYLSVYDTTLPEIDVSNNPNLLNLDFFSNEALGYVNLSNGNSAEIQLGEGFYITPNVQFVCVDDLDFFNSWYYQQLEQIGATVSTNCAFGENQLNTITGMVKYDIGAGCDDASAVIVPNTLVTTQVGADLYATITSANGAYTLYTNEGLNAVTTTSINENFEFNPASQDIDFVGFGNEDNADFCAQATGVINDLEVVIVPLQAAVPGFETTYRITYSNIGTTTMSGEVELTYDNNSQTFLEATPTETSSTTSIITFSFTDLLPFQTEYVDIKFLNEQPPILNSGDLLNFSLVITTVDEDDNPDNNTYSFNQQVINSFDPNDKQVLEGSEVPIGDAGKYLNYIIRFQNTGTANAQKVAIRDTLSDNLDWSSLKMISSSDDYYVNIVNGNAVEFVFNDIDLPFEDADEEGSQGYVAYKIKPKEGIEVGEVMAGDAAIYFDFNEPIITNMVSTEIVDNLKVASEEISAQIQLYPNPVNEILHIQNNSAIIIESVEVYSITGQLLFSRRNSAEINMSQLNTGIYFVKLTTEEGIAVTKKVVKK